MKILIYLSLILVFSFCKGRKEPPLDGGGDIKIEDKIFEEEKEVIKEDVKKEVSGECVTKVFDIQNSSTSTQCKDEKGINEKTKDLSLCDIVVTAPKYSASANLDGYYVQDKTGCGEYKGIAITVSVDNATDFKVGDVLKIKGNYVEYYCFTEINVQEAEKTGAVKGFEPCNVDASKLGSDVEYAEKYEGGFVKIENVEVTDANPDAPKDYGCFVVTGGLNVCNDYKLPYMNKDTDKRKVGDKFEYIMGVIKWSFDKYRLMPRFEDDMKLKSGIITDEFEKDVPDIIEVIDAKDVSDIVDIIDAEVEKDVSQEKKKTIYEIQTSETSKTCSDGGNNTIEENLIIENVVVTAPKFEASYTLDGYYVAEKAIGGSLTAPYFGIMIVAKKDLKTEFKENDFLTIKGNYKEYYCLSEIEVKKFEVLGTSTYPAPSKVETSIFCDPSSEVVESWEGVLIKVEGAEVTDAKPDAKPSTPQIDDWGCFKVNNCLMVCNDYKLTYMNKETDQRKVGDKFSSITGVLKYDWGLYKLMPRSDGDMVKGE